MYMDMAQVGNIQDMSTSEKEEKEDLRPTWSYATRKTVASGMLNASLLLNNAAGLKNLFEFAEDDRDGFWYADLVLIALSIVMQITEAILILVLGFAKAETKPDLDRITKMNNAVTALVLLITLVNIFIAGFNIQINESS